VVPIAVIGTEAIRRGWRIRPHKVRIRAGRPLTFPIVEDPSRALAAAVTDRIWPCVMLQWEWLGGLPPIPLQLPTSSGEPRDTQRAPGSWLTEHGMVPPEGSFPGLDLSFGTAAEPPARETVSVGSGVRVVTAPTRAPAKKAAARKAPTKRRGTEG